MADLEEDPDAPVPINVDSVVSLAQMLYRSALQAKDTDFTLHAGTKTVHCHKLVLHAASEYFQPIVNTGVAQYTFGDDDSVMAEDDVLASVVRFCYLGTVDLTDENVESILAAAAIIEHRKLKQACQKCLLKKLTIDNCRAYQDIAEKFNLKNLKNKCIQMANGELEETQ